MVASKASFRNPEISQQPGGIWSGSLGNLRDDAPDLLRVETVEKEVGNDQIVAVVRRPGCEVGLKKGNPTYLIGSRSQHALPSQFEHSFAAIDAIDPDQRVPLKKCGEKPSIPLAYDQGAVRRTDRVEIRNPRTLQRVSKSDRFQRPVPGRDRIEAHKADAISTTIGVSKTRSASAVR